MNVSRWHLSRKPSPVFHLTTYNDGAAYFFRDAHTPDAPRLDSSLGELDVVISLSSCNRFFNLLVVVKPDRLVQGPVQMLRIRIPVTGMDVHVEGNERHPDIKNMFKLFLPNSEKCSAEAPISEEVSRVRVYICGELHWARSRNEAKALKQFVEDAWRRSRTERAL